MPTKKRQTVAKSSHDLRSTAKSLNSSREEILKVHTFRMREATAQAPAPDENDNLWMGVGTVLPPYEPFVLQTLLEHSNSLRQCIDGYVTNIDAFGHRFEPVIDMTASDANDRIKSYVRQSKLDAMPPGSAVADPTDDEVERIKQHLIESMRDELLGVQHFFEYACLDQSFVSLRRKTRQDIETLGNAYWECIEDESGGLAGFEYIPGFTMRHMPADLMPTSVKVRVKKDLFTYKQIDTKKYFRRYVQVFETRTIYFKEFGDPRVVSRKTGRYFNTVEELFAVDRSDEPANAVFHFKVHTSKSSYGIPRWIGTILSVLGSRQAEEVNHSYFENKSVPPMAILVSGGKISTNTVTRIKDFMENDIKGKRNFHKILVLEAESPGTSNFDTGRMKIEMKPLTAAQHNDALFQTYDQNNIDKVGMAFRLPRMLRGDIRDFNRATADAAIEFAEQQVFKPERDEFDFTMNRAVLTALKVRFWKFKSNAPEGHTATELAEILSKLGTVGFMTPAEGRDLMEKIFNRPFQKIDAPWVRQPIALTEAGIVPPDQLMAPGMTTPQSAATGAPGAVGGAPMAGLQAPAAVATGTGTVSLTGTDVATVVTVNESRQNMGLGPLKTRDGAEDPDGYLTVAEFKAKRVAAGQTLGVAQAQEASGITPTGQTTPESGAQPEQKNSSLLGFAQQLLALRKAFEMIDSHEAESTFNTAKALEDVEKKGPAELHIEHPDGKVTVSSHPSDKAARAALATHLDANGGTGKAVITKPGNKLGLKPIPVKGGWHNQYGSG